jgi:aryl-alcohol dehydrogenase-like predicted oxidoreductase
LVLGGHSFIRQLGTDPAAGPVEQVAIVQACLDARITWFDTTYQPERVALGAALKVLGRRDEATILAWNFFTDFGPDDEVGGPVAYQREHIQQMLAQLQTDRIDCLVVHGVPDPAEQQRQFNLARQWQAQGLVRRLGCWNAGEAEMEQFAQCGPGAFVVRPYNVTTPNAAADFAAAKRLGLETLACSPFVRGWELDKLLGRALERIDGNRAALLIRLADHMLRYSLFAENVDRLIVSIRKPAYVAANAASVARGPLADDQRQWLLGLLSDTR